MLSSIFAALQPWLQVDNPTRLLDIHNAVESLNSILLVVLGQVMPMPSITISTDDETLQFLQQWTTVPVTSDWQTEEEREISIRAYNLVVACCVTNFSGYERDEFHLNLLKRKPGGTSYFGISMHEGRVSGSINEDVAMKVRKLWTMLRRHAPFAASLDLSTALELAKESEWFDTSGPDQNSVARYAENSALMLLLDYCDICVSLAATANHKDEKPFRLALSTVLPLVCLVCVHVYVFDGAKHSKLMFFHVAAILSRNQYLGF